MTREKRGFTYQIFRLLSSKGQRKLRVSIAYAVAAGAVRGLALIVFLPAVASMVKNQPVWGARSVDG